jgi:hypothetical protein
MDGVADVESPGLVPPHYGDCAGLGHMPRAGYAEFVVRLFHQHDSELCTLSLREPQSNPAVFPLRFHFHLDRDIGHIPPVLPRPHRGEENLQYILLRFRLAREVYGTEILRQYSLIPTNFHPLVLSRPLRPPLTSPSAFRSFF